MDTFKLYQSLLRGHGNPREIWPQWCGFKKSEEEREFVALGAILTQRTSWANAEMALKNLKKENLWSLQKIAEVDLDKLTELVRVAGFYNTKPRRLKELATFVLNKYGSLETMKESIQQQSKDGHPVHRVGGSGSSQVLNQVQDDAHKPPHYDELKEFFESSLPQDVEVFQNYHVLIIVDQKGREKSLMGEIF